MKGVPPLLLAIGPEVLEVVYSNSVSHMSFFRLFLLSISI